MSDVKLSVINTNVKGVLASRAGFDLPIRVLSSRAGYYIGTFSETLVTLVKSLNSIILPNS